MQAFGPDAAWCDRVHANVARAGLSGQHARRQIQHLLGDRINRQVGYFTGAPDQSGILVAGSLVLDDKHLLLNARHFAKR